MRPVSKALFWSAVQSWGSSLFALTVTIVLARLLEPEDFGLVAMALVYVGFTRMFVDQGLGLALIQRAELAPDHLDSAFWLTFGAGLGLAGLSVLLAEQVAALFGQVELASLVRWLSLSLVFSGLQATQIAVVQRELAFEALAKRTLLSSLAGGIAGITAALSGFGVWSLVVQTLTQSGASTLFLWYISRWRPRLRLSATHVRDLIGFSANTFATSIVAFAQRYSDQLLIGFYLGPVVLGFYTIAYQVLEKMSTLLVVVISRVAFPVFSRYQHEPERFVRSFLQTTHHGALIAFPAFAGMIAVAPEFVVSLYGDKWRPSVEVLQILSLLGIYLAVFKVNNAALLALGMAGWRFGVHLIGAAATALAVWLVVGKGVIAVAIALVSVAYSLAPLTLLLLRRRMDLPIGTYLRQFAVPIGGTLLMLSAVYAMRSFMQDMLPPLAALGLFVATGISIYVGFVAALRPELPRMLFGWLRRRDPATSAGRH